MSWSQIDWWSFFSAIKNEKIRKIERAFIYSLCIIKNHSQILMESSLHENRADWAFKNDGYFVLGGTEVETEWESRALNSSLLWDKPTPFDTQSTTRSAHPPCSKHTGSRQGAARSTIVGLNLFRQFSFWIGSLWGYISKGGVTLRDTELRYRNSLFMSLLYAAATSFASGRSL